MAPIGHSASLVHPWRQRPSTHTEPTPQPLSPAPEHCSPVPSTSVLWSTLLSLEQLVTPKPTTRPIASKPMRYGFFMRDSSKTALSVETSGFGHADIVHARVVG